MNPMKRYVLCALFSMATLCAATASQAQSPFDGTWRISPAQTKFTAKHSCPRQRFCESAQLILDDIGIFPDR